MNPSEIPFIEDKIAEIAIDMDPVGFKYLDFANEFTEELRKFKKLSANTLISLPDMVEQQRFKCLGRVSEENDPAHQKARLFKQIQKSIQDQTIPLQYDNQPHGIKVRVEEFSRICDSFSAKATVSQTHPDAVDSYRENVDYIKNFKGSTPYLAIRSMQMEADLEDRCGISNNRSSNKKAVSDVISHHWDQSAPINSPSNNKAHQYTNQPGL